jgi:hypothetical protein
MDTKKILFYNVVLSIVIFCLASCNCNDDSEQAKSNLSYLSLSTNDYVNMANEDITIFKEAYKRMCIVKDNGFYKTKWTSGEQINISDDLFNFFINMINNSNSLYLNSSRLKKIKTRCEGDGDTGNCGQWAISSVIKSYGGNTTETDVCNWVRAMTNVLNHPVDFTNVCNNYFQGYYISIDNNTFNDNNGYLQQGNQAILVIRHNGSNIGHAVVFIRRVDQCVFYYDSNGQNCVPISDIVGGYEITGLRK